MPNIQAEGGQGSNTDLRGGIFSLSLTQSLTQPLTLSQNNLSLSHKIISTLPQNNLSLLWIFILSLLHQTTHSTTHYHSPWMNTLQRLMACCLCNVYYKALLVTIKRCWLLLSGTGYYQALLDTVKRYWLLLSVVGYYEALLDTIKHCWLLSSGVDCAGVWGVYGIS